MGYVLGAESKGQGAVTGDVFGLGTPDQIVKAARLATSTKALSLPQKGLEAVPPAVWETGSFTMLDLSHNQIKELPMELSMCTSLEVRHIKRGPKALSLKGGKIKKEFRVEI
jgi:hypothetical protein